MYWPATAVNKDYRTLDHTTKDSQSGDLDLSIGTSCWTLLVSLEDDILSGAQIKEFYRYILRSDQFCVFLIYLIIVFIYLFNSI